MVLSLAHLLLLIVHYHVAISSNRTTKVKDFVALILTAWISSATIGCLNSTLGDLSSKIVVVVVFVVIAIAIAKSFHHIHREEVRRDIFYFDLFFISPFTEQQKTRSVGKPVTVALCQEPIQVYSRMITLSINYLYDSNSFYLFTFDNFFKFVTDCQTVCRIFIVTG